MSAMPACPSRVARLIECTDRVQSCKPLPLSPPTPENPKNGMRCVTSPLTPPSPLHTNTLQRRQSPTHCPPVQVLSKDTETLWSYGGVTCKMIPLRGLEQPFIEWREGHPVALPIKTAIECICATDPLTNCLKLDDGKVPEAVLQGRLELIMIPEVQKLLEGKWEEFGKGFFLREFFKGLCTQIIWFLPPLAPVPALPRAPPSLSRPRLPPPRPLRQGQGERQGEGRAEGPG